MRIRPNWNPDYARGDPGPDANVHSRRPFTPEGAEALARPKEFKKGGIVRKTGWAKVHKGEKIVPANALGKGIKPSRKSPRKRASRRSRPAYLSGASIRKT